MPVGDLVRAAAITLTMMNASTCSFSNSNIPTGPRGHPFRRALMIGFLTAIAAVANANGIYRDGIGARSMSLSGADVAWASGPLSALGINPAGLAQQDKPIVELSLSGVIPETEYRSRTGASGKMDRTFGVVPEGAVAFRLGTTPLTLGIGLIPDALMDADWRYQDTPGGANGTTTYGVQRHRSSITVLRSAVGLAADLGSSWSIGGSIGVLYNQNKLQSPYIFQTQPALAGIKTLLDLEADGIGVNGSFGVIYKANEDLRFAAAYTTKSTVHTEGDASGNALAQLLALGPPFDGARPDFHYDAEVDNHFPQIISVGGSWQARPKLRLAMQLDWIGWSDSFDTLTVRLKNGNNADLNGLVGANSAEDNVPLDWHDRLVYRVGAELAAADNLSLRAGYSYGRSPVPDATLTPMTAAIPEHTLSVGAGYNCGSLTLDLTYQYNLPASQNVGTSALRSGEYSGSRVEVGLHRIAIGASLRF